MPSLSNFLVSRPNEGRTADNRTLEKADLFRESNTYDGPNLYRYPIDLGYANKAHYMVFHINEQYRTTYTNDRNTTDLPTILQNRKDYGIRTPLDSVIIPGSEYIASLIKQYVGDIGVPSGSFQTIRRTTDTVALYMPDTLQFQYNQQYADLSLASNATAIATAGGSLYESYKRGDLSNLKGQELLTAVGKNISPFIFNSIGQKSDIGRVLFGGYFGFVQNPQLEIIYSSPKMREFQFDFMFYPRSEREAREVQKILNLLRFHQAPELVQEFNGFFLTPPSEFDIKFYYNGKENPNIPKISTCILTAINIDYAPNGFAAYESPSRIDPAVGETGMPVAIRLSLSFREREILTKAHFARDAGKVVTGTSTNPGGDGTEDGR